MTFNSDLVCPVYKAYDHVFNRFFLCCTLYKLIYFSVLHILLADYDAHSQDLIVRHAKYP